MSLKIGVVSTCIGAEAVYQNYLSESEQIALRLKTVRPDWRFETYRAYLGEFPSHNESCDGYIFSGSPASVNIESEWTDETLNFIRELHASKISMIGICFGHQAIAKALGGKVAHSKEGLSLGCVKVSFSGQMPWMYPQKDVLRLYAAHDEQVMVPPNGAEILGQTDVCPIASFSIGNHIFTTQHHPEMTQKFIAAVIDYFSSDIDPEIARKAKKSLEYVANNNCFAEWMANFLERNQHY